MPSQMTPLAQASADAAANLDKPRMALFLSLIAAAFGIVASTSGYLKVFLPIGCAVYLVGSIRAIRRHEGLASLAMQGGVLLCYLAYWCMREGSAAFYHMLSDLSLAYSGAVGSLIARPIAMGMTYSGVDVVALFVAAAGVKAWVSGSKPFARFAVDLGLIAAIWALYIALWTVLAENSIVLGLNLVEPLTGPLDYRALLFGMLLVAYLARCAHSGFGERFVRRNPARFAVSPSSSSSLSSSSSSSSSAFAVACACAVAVASAALVFTLLYKPGAPTPPAEGALVVFWDTGIDFTVPERGKYGLDNVGMFGALPGYLRGRGYRCRIVKQIDEAALDGADVLVALNPMAMPGQAALTAIWGFARRGGGVLAVGDHTGHEQIRLPLNAILSPVGIEFNFDSAIPFQALWPNGYVMRKSPVFCGVDGRQIQTVVGASLKIGYGARLLLVGANAFSDGGDLGNETDGYLGDMRFSRGERVGDLVLVAEARYGGGVFVAFGDTTAFQNTVLAYSAPFVDNVFAYCAEGRASEGRAGEGRAGEGRAGEVSAGEDSAGEVAYEAYEADGTDGFDIDNNPIYDKYCLIDVDCFPSFSFDKSDESMDGFMAAAMRAGMLPYLNFNESLADAVDRLGDRLVAVVLDEPARSPGAEGLRALWSALGRGVTLVLLGRYESPAATRDICAQFGFGFDNMPIGRISPAQDPDMAFWNACPVIGSGPSSPELRGEAHGMEGGVYESLIEIWGETVVARKPLSGGEVVVFGDSDFLKNKNLEGIDSYRAGNVAFVERLLDRALEVHNQ